MNNKRRKKINKINEEIQKLSSDIEDIVSELSDVLYDEEEAFDNMPENLQYSMRGEESQEAISVLEECVDKLEEISSDLYDISL